jgi:hypothetical protein
MTDPKPEPSELAKRIAAKVEHGRYLHEVDHLMYTEKTAEIISTAGLADLESSLSQARAEKAEVSARLKEYEQLFELQHQRVRSAEQRWQAETRHPHVLPDLGSVPQACNRPPPRRARRGEGLTPEEMRELAAARARCGDARQRDYWEMCAEVCERLEAIAAAIRAGEEPS